MADAITMAKLEEAVFAKEHAKGCLEHFGYQKFHARNTLERSLLLHAFAHMPSAMCAMTSLETHTPVIHDDDTLSWLWLWRNDDLYHEPVEPELRTYRARGIYIITFDAKTRLYAMRVIWDEPRLGLSDSRASSTAIGMHTQLQVLKLLRAAKALGSAYWDEERDAIRKAWDEKTTSSQPEGKRYSDTCRRKAPRDAYHQQARVLFSRTRQPRRDKTGACADTCADRE